MLLILMGCSGGSDTAVSYVMEDLQVSLSEDIPTVVVVSWTGDAGSVRFGTNERERGNTAAYQTDDGRWEAILVGIPAEREGWVKVVQGGEIVGAANVTTGEIDSRIPLPNIKEGSSEGFFMTSVLGSTEYYPVIFDGNGNLVWWHVFDGDREWYTSRVWLSHDGRRVFYNVYNTAPQQTENFSGVVSMKLDGTDIQLIELPSNHHDFWLHEDDSTISYLRYSPQKVFGETVIGDELVVWTEESDSTMLWSGWDNIALTQSDLSENPEGSFWTMANAMEYDEANDAYVLGLRNRKALVKIDGSGEQQWLLGSAQSDFAISDQFAYQHGFEILDGEILLFDNNSDDQDSSQLYRYELNEQSMTAELTWQYRPTPLQYTPYFGDIVSFSGGIASTWGTAGTLRVIDDSGEETFQVAYDPPTSIGFLRWADRIGE
jgi:hypothetical protein